MLAKLAPGQQALHWISHLEIISQLFHPKGLSSCPFLLWPWKRSHRWHLWSLQQSLNLTLWRPKEEDRDGFGQGKKSFRRSASHLVLCLSGERNADANQALGLGSRCESHVSLSLTGCTHLLHKGHPRGQAAVAWNLHPPKGWADKCWEIFQDRSLPHYFRSQAN